MTVISIDDLLSYNYSLLQRDYFGVQLNSSEVILQSTDRLSSDTVSVTVQSLISNYTWSVAVEVNGCMNTTDMTLYTNITNIVHSMSVISIGSSSVAPSLTISSSNTSVYCSSMHLHLLL